MSSYSNTNQLLSPLKDLDKNKSTEQPSLPSSTNDRTGSANRAASASGSSPEDKLSQGQVGAISSSPLAAATGKKYEKYKLSAYARKCYDAYLPNGGRMSDWNDDPWDDPWHPVIHKEEFYDDFEDDVNYSDVEDDPKPGPGMGK